jgi:hypothetical protein
VIWLDWRGIVALEPADETTIELAGLTVHVVRPAVRSPSHPTWRANAC